jgi:penicillin G amidase
MPVKARFIITTLITVGLIILLNLRIGQLPPMGKFLDPVKGVWQNALIADVPLNEEFSLPGLRDSVQIVFNERGVPHIFARNDYDLYFASGFIMAMHRLWQMEFSTHASMGRLSEIVGERALQYDQYIRRLGMTYGAEKMLATTMKDEKVMNTLNAYSDGVNAWISQLESRLYPFEYKMLDYTPEPWTPIKTLALGMGINRTLSSGSRALRMSYLEAVWGRDAILSLYTEDPESIEPIISANHSWNFTPVIPDSPLDIFIPQFIFDDLIEERNPNTGSNNWAVSGRKTLSGNTLFASDPHLGLTLPSIWYEIQLNAPGINSYGVTFPGVPAIIMGFNEYIIWGNTNTGNKVFDIFEIELDDNNTHYLHDGEWMPLTYRNETYTIKGNSTIIDSIPFTHHGPIMYLANEEPFANHIPVAHAIRWTAHESGNVVKPLQDLAHTRNFTQFRSSLSQLHSPPQNYVFASIDGDIGMQLNGLWPIRWQHQGMFVNNGRDSEYDLKEYIPFQHLPYEFNPPRGFVSSANQHPTNRKYPYYLGWKFASPSRASIINQTLSASDQLTADDMKALQLNTDNLWAEKYLQQMIDSVLAYHKGGTVAKPFIQDALDTLLAWNHKNEPYSLATTIFEHWRTETFRRLWVPLLEPAKRFRPMQPSLAVSFNVLFHKQQADVYKELFDNKPTTGEILALSLDSILNRLELNHGPIGENWHWWRFNGSTINHLLNIPALNQPRLQVGGSNESPNAISNGHGPSWRMVAELSTPIKAWGVYPGGQAANPATRGYNAFVKDWAEGNHYELILYKNYKQAASMNKNIMTLTPTN